MKNLKTGMVFQPGALLQHPVAEVGVSRRILVTPGLEQCISQGIGPLLGQAEIHALFALQWCISARSCPERCLMDEPLVGQVLSIQEPGVQGIA